MELLRNFMERYHLDYRDLNVSFIEGDVTLKNTEIANKWYRDHELNASLQCIHWSVNMKHTSGTSLNT